MRLVPVPKANRGKYIYSSHKSFLLFLERTIFLNRSIFLVPFSIRERKVCYRERDLFRSLHGIRLKI